jgi:hypothetical protein
MLMPFGNRPPWPVQREQQRKIIRGRVESIGGWNVLRRESIALLQNGRNEFVWPDGSNTNGLPPVFVQLKPQQIRAYPDSDGTLLVRMKFFGAHPTGMRGIPYYGLWIVCSSNSDNYVPELDFGGNTVSGKINLITNSIFEVY